VKWLQDWQQTKANQANKKRTGQQNKILMNQDNSQNSVKSNPRYIVTPGLTEYFFDFLYHCKAAESSPIMIVGPTGVGKSLFLHTYKKFFENEQRSKGIKRPIVVWANCSHFGGVGSDPNIARAELFGQKQGSSSQANRDRKGLVDTADGGALILEEIGELPLAVQAMLLTFIESGEYREVGGTETKYANVCIVGATNREEALREDFKFRFFPYYLPDLYTRRGDVLYYLSHMHPNLLSTLTKTEVLKILAYHWPGNVREIDRVLRLIYRDKLRSDTLVFDTPEMKMRFQLGRFHRLNERETPFKRGVTADLLEMISDWGGDSELLESLLNRFRVGLSNDDAAPAFNDYQQEFEQHYDEQKGLAVFEKKYDVKLLLPIKQFEDVFKGYLAFCGLFMQDPSKNSNVLENIDDGDIEFHDLSALEYTDDQEEEVNNLAKAIMQYSKKVLMEDHPEVNASPQSFWDELVDFKEILETEEEEVDKNNESNQPQTTDVLDLRENELLKVYYSQLLRKTGYHIKSAADLAGLNQSTFRSKLKKLGVKNKRTFSKKGK
jgi:transcriptional regulator with AAA-type ATPase domain